MFGKRTVRLVSSFSLVLCAVVACGETAADVAARLKGKSGADLKREMRSLNPSALPPGVSESVSRAVSDDNAQAYRAAKEQIEMAAAAEASSSGNVLEKAKQIKSSPLYRDVDQKDESNWLARAANRFGEFIRELLERLFGGRRNAMRAPSVPSAAGAGLWFTYLMWIVIGTTAAVLLVLAVRRFQFKRSLSRKAKAMLEEDEPERTLDEWLAMADRLAAEGKHREAVRCLYLACLLKFDEHNVARFDRGQTNWEHLARIESSPARPSELDFRTPTQAFDRIWYGRRTEGEPDVQRFRTIYQSIAARLAEVPAA